jgi:glutaredoxin
LYEAKAVPATVSLFFKPFCPHCHCLKSKWEGDKLKGEPGDLPYPLQIFRFRVKNRKSINEYFS